MILKPIDNNYVCVVDPQTPDDIFKYVFGVFNDLLFIETDNAGSQLQPVFDKFFAVNRLLAFGPVANTSNLTANKYSRMSYDCLLTIAKPSDARQEIENTTQINDEGQFDEITSQFLTLDFANTFKKYFSCCGFEITAPRIRPVWNVNTYMPAVNYSGVEITFTLTV
jgi:hypothetical protein